MKDFRVTQLPNGRLDFLIVDGKSQFVEKGKQAAQHAVLRLMRIKGESVTGTTTDEGTDYYGIIFNVMEPKAKNILHLKNRILGTPGIKRIITFEYKHTLQSVAIDCFVMTDWGTTEQLSATLEKF